MPTDVLAPLLARMAVSGVAVAGDLVGCTPEEIAALEARYGVRLPHTYRRFLEVMGRHAGRLFQHDSTLAFYPDVRGLTAEYREGYEDDPEVPGALVLPPDALIIAEREGDYFDFIRCTDPHDSPVWKFDVYRWTPVERHASVPGFLEAWCEAAEWAIGQGYFDR